jgi:hypothetical protein
VFAVPIGTSSRGNTTPHLLEFEDPPASLAHIYYIVYKYVFNCRSHHMLEFDYHLHICIKLTILVLIIIPEFEVVIELRSYILHKLTILCIIIPIYAFITYLHPVNLC